MNRFKLLFALMAFILIAGFSSKTYAQNGPVLYFCESYGTNGEIGISDRYHTGYLTVMVRCDYELGLRDCSIQFDKYNPRTTSFEYYKKFNYTIKPSMKYVFLRGTQAAI